MQKGFRCKIFLMNRAVQMAESEVDCEGRRHWKKERKSQPLSKEIVRQLARVALQPT